MPHALPVVRTRAELRHDGMSRVQIEASVAAGILVRARRDRYLPGDAPDDIIRAVRLGGRLTCLSLLELCGVFVQTRTALHVHIPPNGSRMRSPDDRAAPLPPRRSRQPVLHWGPLLDGVAVSDGCVALRDALVHATRCQSPRAAVASLDSALHLGLIDADDLGEIRHALPRRRQALVGLTDRRAESGPETLVRLLVRGLGVRVELQVTFEGIGRVDLLIDGWLVVECDSREFHSSWEQQHRDRRRDLALAALGYTVIRPSAQDIMGNPDAVLEAIRGLLRTRRR